MCIGARNIGYTIDRSIQVWRTTEKDHSSLLPPCTSSESKERPQVSQSGASTFTLSESTCKLDPIPPTRMESSIAESFVGATYATLQRYPHVGHPHMTLHTSKGFRCFCSRHYLRLRTIESGLHRPADACASGHVMQGTPSIGVSSLTHPSGRSRQKYVTDL